jgi:DNA-binding transcriptional LysR family regulator
MIAPDANALMLLLAVAEHGSINHAATALHMSQPALSLKIKTLEHQLGVSVLDRHATGATLTAYGEILVHHARAIRNARTNAAEDVRLRLQGGGGRFVIGATPIALVNLVPWAANRLSEEFAPLSLRIVEGADAMLNDQLRARALDIVVGVVGIEAGMADIVETALMEDPLDLVMRPGGSLAGMSDGERSVSLSHLTGRRWALPEPGSSFQRQVAALFAVAGLTVPPCHVTCASLLAIRRMTMMSDRLAILPRQAVRDDCAQRLLTAIPIAGPGTTRAVGYRLRANDEILPIKKRFLALLAQAAATVLQRQAG